MINNFYSFTKISDFISNIYVNKLTIFTAFTSENKIEKVAEHSSTDGLPQFDFSTYPSQIFWLFIVFAILYSFMAGRALPKIAHIIERRKDRIADDLDRASELEKEMSEIISTKDNLLQSALEKASSITAEARSSMNDIKNSKLEQLSKKLLAQNTINSKKFKQIKQIALDNIDYDASIIATKIINKII